MPPGVRLMDGRRMGCKRGGADGSVPEQGGTMERLPKRIPTGRGILCLILCVFFTALTTFQFSYYAAYTNYRVRMAETVQALQAERDAAIAERDAMILAREDTIAGLSERAEALSDRLVALTGAEDGSAEDCLRLLLAASLRRADGIAGSADEKYIDAQVDAYMERYASDFTAVAEKLLFLDYLYRTNYIGTLDTAALDESLVEAYIAAAGDIYGHYYTEEEYEDFRLSMESAVCGIGTVVGSADGGRAIAILHVHSHSPAATAGLQAGDLIRSLDGQTVESLGYAEACAGIAGEEGSTVTLGIERAGEPFTRTLLRARVTADVVLTRIYTAGSDRIGYLRITEFTAQTDSQFRKACEEMEAAGVSALIFDLRDNGGGLLSSILHTLDYICPAGTPLISYEYRNPNLARETYYAEDPHTLTVPMYVLQNERTASAAELFCACLGQGGATLIGTTTYGKGTMQTGYTLEDGSYITVSVALYAPGTGENYEGHGVEPDYAAYPSEGYEEVSVWQLPASKDGALQTALSLCGAG